MVWVHAVLGSGGANPAQEAVPAAAAATAVAAVSATATAATDATDATDATAPVTDGCAGAGLGGGHCQYNKGDRRGKGVSEVANVGQDDGLIVWGKERLERDIHFLV